MSIHELGEPCGGAQAHERARGWESDATSLWVKTRTCYVYYMYIYVVAWYCYNCYEHENMSICYAIYMW